MASKVLDLLYWRDVGTTGLVFTGLVVGLACLFQLSAITILSNLGLGIMAFTLPLCLLYKAMTLVRLNDGSHPFHSEPINYYRRFKRSLMLQKETQCIKIRGVKTFGIGRSGSYLDEDRTLTDEDTVRMAEQIVLLIATAVTELKRLFFIDSIMDSVKFVVFLYLLSYVGVQTNGLTLVMTGVICAFSLPLLYKLQQERIDKIVKAIKTLVEKGTEIVDLVISLAKPPPAPAPSPAPTPKHKQKTK